MRLSNGLEFIAQATASRQVCVQWWLRVNTQSQPLAFQQLAQQLFEGSRFLPGPGFTQLVREAGGLALAKVLPDGLLLQTSGAATQLEALLWAEAERFTHLQIADPTQAAFAAQQLRTDQCLLVVTGGFEPPSLQRFVAHYWDSLRAPREPWVPPPVAPPLRPPTDWPIRRHYGAPSTPLLDCAGLHLLASLLGQGESSRLHDSLCVHNKTALRTACTFTHTRHAGLLSLQAQAAPQHSVAELHSSLHDELRRVAQEPLSDEELSRARAQQLTQALVQRQHPAGLAEQLATGLCRYGDSDAQRQLEAEWSRFTVAHIQRLAALVLTQPVAETP